MEIIGIGVLDIVLFLVTEGVDMINIEDSIGVVVNIVFVTDNFEDWLDKKQFLSYASGRRSISLT